MHQKKPADSERVRRALYVKANLELLNLAGTLLTIPFTSEGFFGAPLFTWLQVKRMPLDFLHNVLLLDLAFETTERTFESLSILYVDFSH